MTDKNKNFLETEEAIQSLLAELDRLKKSADEIDIIKSKAGKLVDISVMLIEKLDIVSKTTEKFFDDIAKTISKDATEIIKNLTDLKKENEKQNHDLAVQIKYMKILAVMNLIGLMGLIILIILLKI